MKIRMKDLKPIRSEADHAWALAAIDSLMDAKHGSDEGRMLDILADLVEHYEERHHPMPKADPLEVIKTYMQSHGLRQRDVTDIFGTQGRASEVLSGKRPLTAPMIARLRARFGLSADVLLSDAEALESA